jgi:hypothetical protein
MPKLKLVKVLVQPVFVLDDGENVTELDHPPVAIPAAEWPTYSGERFPREVKAWQKQIDQEHAAQNGNRAERRARARAK